MVRNFNNLLSITDIKSKQKVSKDTVVWKNTINYLDLNVLYPTTAECTFFSCAHGAFTNIHYTLGHKTSVNNFSFY